jgi:PAS domain S-box-containing protein
MAKRKKQNSTGVTVKKTKPVASNKLSFKKKTLKLSPAKTDNFRMLFDQADFGVLVFDFEGKIYKANTRFEQISGFTLKELKQLSTRQFTHPTDLEKETSCLNNILTGIKTSQIYEKRLINKSGNIFYAKLNVLQYKSAESKKFIAYIEKGDEELELKKQLEFDRILLRALMENTQDTIYFKDRESRFVKVNSRMATKHNLPDMESVLDKTDFDIFGPDHALDAYTDEQKIIQTGKPILGKIEKEDWKSGTITWGSTSKMPLLDSEGNIIGTFGITRDITEQVLNEERIKESEQIYRSLFENAADGIFLINDIFIDCNDSICKMFKRERGEIIGAHPVDFSPEFQPNGKTSFELANEKIQLALQGVPQRFMWKHIRKDGSLIDTEISLNLIQISGKKLVQAIVRDITLNIKNEKLREVMFEISEAAYTALDTIELYKQIHSSVGKLMSVKNFYIALFDDKTEIVSFPYFIDEYDEPIPPRKLSRGLTDYVLRAGEAILVNPEKDLELRRTGDVDLIGAPQAIWLGVPLKVGGKSIGVIVVQDYENEKAFGIDEMQLLSFVSSQVALAIERKKNSDEIKKYAEELKQLNSTKDKFFSIIAHDLRNPFITILGFSDLLLTDYEELSDKEKKYYIDEMKKSAEISHDLLQNLLQWSRSQTGRIEFNPTKLSLEKIAKGNLELLKATAERKQITINSKLEDEIYVLADEDMLNTVIRNLITNAIKFTNVNGTISIGAKLKDDLAEIYVIDNGVGMDRKQIANLFRLEVSHSTTGTYNEVGTGLGLLLCKEFVEKNGGTIWVESEPGKGTNFSFSIPLAKQLGSS